VTYTTDDVARATGLTYRQVDRIVTRRYVDHPRPQPGTGQPRTFDDAQLDRIGAIAALIQAGLTPRRAAVIAQSPEYELGPVQIQIDTARLHHALRARLHSNVTPTREATA
jgi:DNA-binding transcriptional MerR regulator